MNYSIKHKKELKFVDNNFPKLAVQFCKQHKIMHLLYNAKLSQRVVSNYIDFGYRLMSLENDGPKIKMLQISQLWRFFILNAIENNEECKGLDDIKGDLIYSIRCNGHRNSKEIEELFKKHNLS